MKRSEAIEIMIKADKEQSSCNSLHNMMSNILLALEKGGMKPPHFLCDDDIDPLSLNDLADCANLDGKYVWEKEDE